MEAPLYFKDIFVLYANSSACIECENITIYDNFRTWFWAVKLKSDLLLITKDGIRIYKAHGPLACCLSHT